MIDGFRRGFFGVSDVSPWLSLARGRRQLRGGVGASRCTCCRRATSCAIELHGDNLRHHDRAHPPAGQRFIAAGLACEHVEVEGDGRHFFATIVSAGLRRAARAWPRHQQVYAALGDRMREQIHALSMKTLTPAEWAAQQAAEAPRRPITPTDTRPRRAAGGVRVAAAADAESPHCALR